MDVPVKDANFLDPEVSLSHSCSDTCVVIEAESASFITVGMMTWRSYDSEGGIDLVGADSPSSFDSTTCSHQSCSCSKSILIGVDSHISYVLLGF